MYEFYGLERLCDAKGKTIIFLYSFYAGSMRLLTGKRIK